MGQPNGADYGLVGTSGNVELGKGGPRLKASGGVVEVRNPGDSALAIARAADGVGPTDVATVAQLEAGRSLTIAVPFVFGDFAGLTKESTTVPPATAIMLSAYIRTEIAFDAGTVAVGRSGSASHLLAPTDSDLTQAATNNQGGITNAPWSLAFAVRLTFTGSPTQGSGIVYVTYTIPLT